jgi:hypothetical protein
MASPTNPEATEPQLFDSLRLELRRGCLIVAVLAQLRVEHYGYTLRKALADEGLAIEESTLYPSKPRASSPASGAKKTSATNVSTGSPPKAKPPSPSF